MLVLLKTLTVLKYVFPLSLKTLKQFKSTPLCLCCRLGGFSIISVFDSVCVNFDDRVYCRQWLHQRLDISWIRSIPKCLCVSRVGPLPTVLVWFPSQGLLVPYQKWVSTSAIKVLNANTCSFKINAVVFINNLMSNTAILNIYSRTDSTLYVGNSRDLPLLIRWGPDYDTKWVHQLSSTKLGSKKSSSRRLQGIGFWRYFKS